MKKLAENPLLLLVSGLVITAVVYFVSIFMGHHWQLNSSIVEDSVLNHGTMLVLSVLLILAFKKQVKYRIAMPKLEQILKPILFGFICAVVINVVMNIISVAVTGSLQTHPLMKNTTFLKNFLSVFILASIGEEFLFRGFFQNYLKPLGVWGFKVFKRRISLPVLISALTFSAAHLILLASGVDTMFIIRILVFTFVLGLIAGYYQEKHDNHIFAIIVHMAGNLMGLISVIMMSCSHQPQTLQKMKSEFVTIDDSINVHYKIWNPNAELKTLCFIHGFGCDMNTWEKQFEAFRDNDVQLVFIDLPGYGKSDKPHVDYTFDFFAHAIDEVLNANNIKDAVFVGHSLGTPVCRHTLMTTNHSGAFVDVDGVYCFYDGTETPEYIEAINQFGHAFDGPDCREVITGFVSSLAGKDTPQWITDYAMSVMPETPQYVASSTMQHLVEPQWWHNTQLTLPVMVICTQNSGLEPDNEQKMQALYPNLDYTELTTCGHFIHMEQAEMFNEKLKDFISNMKNKQGKVIGIGGVYDMDAIVERLRADGVRFVDDVTEYEGLGKFVHIEDNEARRVELWEPAK